MLVFYLRYPVFNKQDRDKPCKERIYFLCAIVVSEYLEKNSLYAKHKRRVFLEHGAMAKIWHPEVSFANGNISRYCGIEYTIEKHTLMNKPVQECYYK